MKRCVALLSIAMLCLPLMTPTVLMGASASIQPVDKLWALIVAGDYIFTLDPSYLKKVLTNNYSFSGINYLAGIYGKQDVRDAITGWLRSKSDSDDLIFIFIMSHGGGYYWNKKQLYGSNSSIDGSRGDPRDEGNEFRETDVNIDFDGDGVLESNVWGGIDESIRIRMYEVATPEFYWDDELKQDLANLSYGRLILFFEGDKAINETEDEGCFGGGFIDDLSAPSRIIIAPSNETTFGWTYQSPGTNNLAGCMSRPFINALDPEPHPLLDDNGDQVIDPETGEPIMIDAFHLADINGDGVVSIWEAFRYAYQNNKAVEGFWQLGEFCQETPWLDDDGNGLPTFMEGHDVLDNDDGLLSYRTFFSSTIPKNTDVNWNGKVWLEDIGAIQAAWLTKPGDYWWNPYVDFDNNGYINVADVSRIAKDWQKTFFPGGSTGGTRTQTETQTPELSVTPNEIIVNKYQTFSVDITITDVTDLYSYQFYLNYNSMVLNCTGVDLPPCHFLEPLEPDNILIVEQVYNNTYNATHGRLGVAATLLGDEPGKNGSGTLATINFKALAVGSTTLHFYDIVICNSVPEAMPVITVDGSVTVHPTLTVLAEDLDGNSLTTGYVYIDSQYRGRTGSNFTVSVGTHEVKVTDFWESGGTGHRYGFKNWTDGSTDNHRIINIVEDKTVTAHFKKKLCPGDVDGNGKVSSYDLFALSDAFGSRPGDPNWDSTCDLDGDGYVGSADLFILSDNFGKTYPDP